MKLTTMIKDLLLGRVQEQVLPLPDKHVIRTGRELLEHMQRGGRARLVAFHDDPGAYEVPVIDGHWPLIIEAKLVQGDGHEGDELALLLENTGYGVLYVFADDKITLAPAE